jgi:DNA-binding IclR family transcriptional regulator
VESESLVVPSTTVRSVERCIDIVDALASARAAMSLSALSRAIQTPKSTTLTIVRTLVRRGLVAIDPATKLYQIGLGFARYTSERPQSVSLIEVAAPFLESLARDTLETATLAMQESGKVYNVCRFVGPQPLQLHVTIGVARELHATAGGKVFLAWMERTQRRAILAARSLPRFTPRTLTEPLALERRLVAARRLGYAIARGESDPDLFAIAAPIFGRDGSVIAAVNLAGPLFRLQSNRARYAAAVRASGAAISDEIARIGSDVALPSVKTLVV